MYEELSMVALTENIPSYKLEIGDVGTIVFIHKEGLAYEVEFVANDGSNIAVLTLEPHQFRKTEGGKEIMHVKKNIGIVEVIRTQHVISTWEKAVKLTFYL